MKLEVFIDTMIQENTYVYYDKATLDAVVIDPSLCFKKEKEFIKKNKLKVKYILLTHGHADHIGDVLELKKFTGAEVVAHKKEKPMLNDQKKNLSDQFFAKGIEFDADIYVTGNDVLTLGKHKFSFLETPGHTEGGMCIICGNEMFSGDTLFKGSVGRTDFYGGDYEKLLKSLKKLSNIDEGMKVYPGHGPATTIGEEKKSNYYMGLVR